MQTRGKHSHTDSFSDSDSESSVGSEILENQSGKFSSESDAEEGSDPSGSFSSNSSASDKEPVAPALSAAVSSIASQKSIAEAASKLQYLREGRRLSKMSMNSVQHDAHPIQEEDIQTSRSQERDSKDGTLWPKVDAAELHHVINKASSPTNTAQAPPEEIKPALHPVVESVALPSTSAWIVSHPDHNGTESHAPVSVTGHAHLQEVIHPAPVGLAAAQYKTYWTPEASKEVCRARSCICTSHSKNFLNSWHVLFWSLGHEQLPCKLTQHLRKLALRKLVINRVRMASVQQGFEPALSWKTCSAA